MDELPVVLLTKKFSEKAVWFLLNKYLVTADIVFFASENIGMESRRSNRISLGKVLGRLSDLLKCMANLQGAIYNAI